MTKEKAFWTHEISRMLNVSDSTLRKWCLELEKHGYVFTKGKNNSRAFLVRDRDLLTYIKRLVQSDGMTIKNASYKALQDFNLLDANGSNDTRSSVPVTVRESFEREFKNINDRLDQQDEFNQKLLERMEQRDKNLMAVLNEIQESKKQIAATKKKWWQFWK